ncbi:putative nucleic acid-binding protein [Helianthus anomalus]
MSKMDTSSVSAMSKKDCSSVAPLPSIYVDLHPSRSEFTIKIRILRAWNRMSFKNENEIYALEMLVVDEEGSRRQRTCLKTFLKKFGPLLQEGSTVIIKNPTLGDNLSSFKYVDCPHKICLYYDSKVIKCNDFLGSDNGFSFTLFSSILDKTFQNTQPIGQYTLIQIQIKIYILFFNIFIYNKYFFLKMLLEMFEFVMTRNLLPVKMGKNQLKERCSLKIKSLGNKIYVTLWDSYVHQFNDYISQNPGVTRVVLIIQFGKLSWFRDKPYVSNSYTLTKVFINHDFNEIQEFQTRYCLYVILISIYNMTTLKKYFNFTISFLFNSKSLKESSSGSVSGSQRSTGSIFYYFRDDFLVHTDFKFFFCGYSA